MTLVRVLSAAIAFALAGCGPPSIPPALQYATVAGKVFDAATSQGIPGVVVTINGIQAATSDATGAFRIANVPNGVVDWFADGGSKYTQPSGSLTLTPGQNYTLSIPLTHL